MRTFIIGFLVFCVWAGYSRYHYVCEIKGMCEEYPTVIAADGDSTKQLPPRTSDLVVKSGDEVILEGYDQFGFYEGSSDPVMTASNGKFIRDLASWLKNNPDRKVKISGKYLAAEKEADSGILENIGLARANKIRNFLVKAGIDEGRMSLDSDELPEGAVLGMPISFDVPEAEEETEFAEVAMTFTNMTYSDANFEYNSAVFDPGPQFKTYADSVKTHFDDNPDKKLIIIGHTDAKGGDNYNNKLGLERAKSARKFFEGLGLEGGRISVDSKGKREPVAPNDTDENRQKNRRVNIIIE